VMRSKTERERIAKNIIELVGLAGCKDGTRHCNGTDGNFWKRKRLFFGCYTESEARDIICRGKARQLAPNWIDDDLLTIMEFLETAKYILAKSGLISRSRIDRIANSQIRKAGHPRTNIGTKTALS
jgi:hypothetical protein